MKQDIPCGCGATRVPEPKGRENDSLGSQSVERRHEWQHTCPDDKRAHWVDGAEEENDVPRLPSRAREGPPKLSLRGRPSRAAQSRRSSY